MNGVYEALKGMRERRLSRGAEIEVYGTTRRADLAALREAMFSRRSEGEAFHELEHRELALLESVVDGYRQDRQLQIVGEIESDDSHRADYRMIRHNLLSGEEPILAGEFREASSHITDRLIGHVCQKFGIQSDATIVLPWRAGLAFADAAHNAGIRNWYHIGAARNEKTLQTEIYYHEIPRTLEHRNSAAFRQVILGDPMLATGNTVVCALSRLKELGVKESNITVVSVISAPEGVDHVLHSFPQVRIVVGNHDERLNDRGYIEPGLGDYGDLYFDGLGAQVVDGWYTHGILTATSVVALLKRMQLASSAKA
jgi:uracil phosphoribosyltransferase